MSIDQQGFLSPDIANWVTKHRAESATWFTFAGQLNSSAQSLLHALSVTTQEDGLDSRLLAMLLFTRALSNFQGTVLMAERGMVVEARTLARSCLESTFCLAAMVYCKADFASEFRRATLKSRKARAEYILKEPGRLEFTDVESADKLRAYAERLKDHPEQLSGLNFEQIAAKVGFADMYVFYRQLSADAAHPSLEALERYIREDNSVRWGPNCQQQEIADTLNIACHFLIGACAAINDLAKNEAFGSALAGHLGTYKELNGIQEDTPGASNS